MGRILGPFGIQGWVKLRTFTESPDGLAGHREWWLRTKAGWRSAALEEFKVRPAAVSAKLEGVDDRNARRSSELRRGGDTRESARRIFWIDLVGMAVGTCRARSSGRWKSC
jgi:16S rRNA processing protein RimM